MSPTSYQAAPPRAKWAASYSRRASCQGLADLRASLTPPVTVETFPTARDYPRVKGAPPPLPPRVRKPPPLVGGRPAPLPTDDGIMSTRAKMSLADMALALRDEQLQARIVHYKADLQTSPELDAITAQVVAELQQLQKAAGLGSLPAAAQADRSQIEIELI